MRTLRREQTKKMVLPPPTPDTGYKNFYFDQESELRSREKIVSPPLRILTLETAVSSSILLYTDETKGNLVLLDLKKPTDILDFHQVPKRNPEHFYL